jgi:hypothetical protein
VALRAGSKSPARGLSKELSPGGFLTRPEQLFRRPGISRIIQMCVGSSQGCGAPRARPTAQEERGLTIRQIAAEANVSAMTVQRLLAGLARTILPITPHYVQNAIWTWDSISCYS